MIGQSGTGKSSVIAWLCSQLPASHVALRIPVTGVADPGSVGEVARLTLSITLDEILLDASEQAHLEQARAYVATTARSPAAMSAKLGSGPIPAEGGVVTQAQRHRPRACAGTDHGPIVKDRRRVRTVYILPVLRDELGA